MRLAYFSLSDSSCRTSLESMARMMADEDQERNSSFSFSKVSSRSEWAEY